MILADIPHKSKIYEECSDGSTYFVYDHPDGMYSYCITEKGAVVHLGLMQPLMTYKDGYKFTIEPIEAFREMVGEGTVLYDRNSVGRANVDGINAERTRLRNPLSEAVKLSEER